MKEPPQLCRNMGSPPKTTIRYAGIGAGASPDLSHDPGFGVYGASIRFTVPAGLIGHTPSAILRFLGEPAKGPTERRLLDLIEARAAELPLPDGCVVVPCSPADSAPWPDALSALAVITKCSEAVWLRVKSPVLESLKRRHEVSLLIPPAFVRALPRSNP
jgi:hypothetical protein